MKRIVLSSVLLLVAIAMRAQTTFTQGNFAYTVTDEGAKTVSIGKAEEAIFSGALVIPESVANEGETYSVTSIAESGFSNLEITSVSIPAFIESIGNCAFQGCGFLASITIEDSETPLTMTNSWYERPFWTDATTIYIGRNLSFVNAEEIPLLYSATSVTFGEKVTAINPYLFKENANLVSLTIGSAVTTIGDYAFYGCGINENIAETVVDMGAQVTTIGVAAFSGCSHLKSIALPSVLTTIDESAFNASGLTSISIPASVESIGNCAFQNCGNLASITIEDNETPLTISNSWYERPFWTDATTIYIGRNLSFVNAEEIPLLYGATSVTFGEKVTGINPHLFKENANLASINIGSAVTTIGEYAFYACGNNEEVAETVVDMGAQVTTIGVAAFGGCSHLKSIALPSVLTTIDESAFNGSGLTGISIPASVESIGNCAFQNCGNLASITIEDSETPLTISNSWYERPFWTDATTIYLGRNLSFVNDEEIPLLYSATSVTFGEKMTTINPHLFKENPNITSVKSLCLTPLALPEDFFMEEVFSGATLWIPGGTKEAYEAADGWKKFANMDFVSFVVSITGSAHGTLSVADISSTNGVPATTLIDRETDAVFTATPAEAYELTTFTVNGEAKTLTEGTYTVSNLLADQTVVAGFTPIVYNLSYELAGGEVAQANPTTYTVESATFALNNPTKKGYDFTGWTGTGLEAATKAVTIAKGSFGERSYTATWTPIIYQITLDLDGGRAENPTTYTIESETITLAAPTKTGYTFKGWKLNGEGEPQMNVTIAKGSTGNVAYTAAWQKNVYAVTITGNGVTADKMAPEYGDNVVITITEEPNRPLNTLTVNGVDVTADVVDHTYTITNVTGNVTVEATFSDFTRVQGLKANMAAPGNTYDITGRKVPVGEKLTRGIYIINGRKVSVR